MGLSPHLVSGVPPPAGPLSGAGADGPVGLGEDLCTLPVEVCTLGEISRAHPRCDLVATTAACPKGRGPAPPPTFPAASPSLELSQPSLELTGERAPYPHGESNPGYHLERVMS